MSETSAKERRFKPGDVVVCKHEHEQYLGTVWVVVEYLHEDVFHEQGVKLKQSKPNTKQPKVTALPESWLELKA